MELKKIDTLMKDQLEKVTFMETASTETRQCVGIITDWDESLGLGEASFMGEFYNVRQKLTAGIRKENIQSLQRLKKGLYITFEILGNELTGLNIKVWNPSSSEVTNPSEHLAEDLLELRGLLDRKILKERGVIRKWDGLFGEISFPSEEKNASSTAVFSISNLVNSVSVKEGDIVRFDRAEGEFEALNVESLSLEKDDEEKLKTELEAISKSAENESNFVGESKTYIGKVKTWNDGFGTISYFGKIKNSIKEVEQIAVATEEDCLSKIQVGAEVQFVLGSDGATALEVTKISDEVVKDVQEKMKMESDIKAVAMKQMEESRDVEEDAAVPESRDLVDSAEIIVTAEVEKDSNVNFVNQICDESVEVLREDGATAFEVIKSSDEVVKDREKMKVESDMNAVDSAEPKEIIVNAEVEQDTNLDVANQVSEESVEVLLPEKAEIQAETEQAESTETAKSEAKGAEFENAHSTEKDLKSRTEAVVEISPPRGVETPLYTNEKHPEVLAIESDFSQSFGSQKSLPRDESTVRTLPTGLMEDTEQPFPDPEMKRHVKSVKRPANGCCLIS